VRFKIHDLELIDKIEFYLRTTLKKEQCLNPNHNVGVFVRCGKNGLSVTTPVLPDKVAREPFNNYLVRALKKERASIPDNFEGWLLLQYEHTSFTGWVNPVAKSN